MELTILMPCLNEEKTIKTCIDKALNFIEKNNINGEVLIADNGSTDKCIEIIKTTKARLTNVLEKGYGSALIKGIKESKGKYIIMCDSDDSYDLDNLMPFLEELSKGNDLVMGNRYAYIEKGAMSISHYFGVKFLTILGNIIYKTKLHDYHCGLRGFNKNKIKKLNLECKGMEFASEIILKSKKANYKIVEITTKLFKDGRGHKSHLNTIRDGIRHVKCLIKYKKNYNNMQKRTI